MVDLTPRQRAVLRSLGHSLKPIVQIGKDGVSEAVVKTVTEALGTHELLKVRVLDTAPADPSDLGAELVESIDDAHLIQVIGRTMVLYRRHPTEPRVTLPGI
jgi:RNA-binding protein